MATENVPVYNQYQGNGVATDFSIGFPYLEKEYVKVYIKRSDGVQETLSDNRYTFVNDTTIRFPVLSTDTVLEEGDVIAIQRETPLGSEYEFTNQQRLFPETVMDADDLSFQQIQELNRELERCFKSLPTDTNTGQQLYEAYLEALNTVNQKIDMVVDLINGLGKSQAELAELLAQAQAVVDELGTLADDINGEVI